MPTQNERITSIKKKISKKQTRIDDLNKTLQNTQNNIHKAKADLEAYEEKLQELEAKVLAETLHKRGIDISEIKAAVEAGFFDKAEKPPDNPSDTRADENKSTEKGATYSTENNGAICSTDDETAESGSLTNKEENE